MLGQRVVGQADDVLDLETGLARPGAEFRRTDELAEIVGPARQQLEDVLRADHRKQVGLGIAVDGREENLSARLDQAVAGADHRGRVRHVFEHLQAGDHVELPGHFLGHLLGGDLPVVDGDAGFQLVQARHRERRFAHVDAGDVGAALGHGFAEDAAAATDVEHLLAGQAGALVDPVDAQRVDVVERLELALASHQRWASASNLAISAWSTLLIIVPVEE